MGNTTHLWEDSGTSHGKGLTYDTQKGDGQAGRRILEGKGKVHHLTIPPTLIIKISQRDREEV